MSVSDRAWSRDAVRIIEADFNRSADTHLIPLRLPGLPRISLYFKDESSHPTGSLKHRLARSLFLYALSNGWLRRGSTVVEASSGSTAISEAYFARLLGLPFVAVVPKTTSPEKIAQIAFYGGRCHFVDHASEVYDTAAAIAADTGGHYLDQFTYAERATDWRGNNNIAESIFAQMRLEPQPCPRYIVCAAEPAARPRRSAATCAIAATKPRSWSPIPRTRCSSTTTRPATGRSRIRADRASRASAARASKRRSCATRSTRW